MQNKIPAEFLNRLQLRTSYTQSTGYQFCLHQIGDSDRYRLLRSKSPQKNEPADYSVVLAVGTIEDMIDLKKQIIEGVRDENGRLK